MKKSSLVIVYHRQPYEEVVEHGEVVLRANRSPNGIVPTLKSFFARLDPGAGSWVAWKASETNGSEFERVVHVDDVNGGYNVSRLPLTEAQVESFYHVTSKEALWPILHSFPRLFRYENVDWNIFREVNRRFAEAAAEQAADDALVWVHDYNLWLVPQYLRAINPRLRIAFFHHTPFPAPDVFNVMPWRAEIMSSLLCCDLVGFHIPRYAKNFGDVARGLAGARAISSVDVDPMLAPAGQPLTEYSFVDQLDVNGHVVHVDAQPVGADPDLIARLLSTRDAREFKSGLRAGLGGRRLLMAVGRTDYTKGMSEALLAFERLLERRPELRTTLKLLVTSVRAASGMQIYADTQREIEALVGRINGRFSTLDWTPAVLFSNAIPFEELISYYQLADVCITTPLRDGLNLVAKEFVAAKAGRPGVLVLSEFAGCAVELSEAVLTNPYSKRSMDNALDCAIDMSEIDAARRMTEMDRKVRRYDMAHWTDHSFRRFSDVTPRSLVATGIHSPRAAAAVVD